MLVDIQMMGECRHRFWWTVAEQLDAEDRGDGPPVLCRRCRSSQNAIAGGPQNAIAGRADLALGGNSPLVVLEDLPASMGDQDQILTRIQELLLYSASGYVPRTPTFLEWLRNQDPNLAEIQARQWAGQHAQQLMAARHELLRLVRDQDDTFRHRVEQHVAAKLALMRGEVERQSLVAEYERIELQREIARLEASARHKALIEPPTPPRQPLDPLRRAAAEHRQRLQVESEAAQDVYSDFLMAVDAVCARRLPLNEKVVRIRRVMEAFEMDEDSLPDNARRILRAAERLRDDD